MQSCLEARAITARKEQIVRSDYNMNDQYSASHKDAISDGDVQGKGSGSIKGHLHWLPDCTKSTHEMNYSNFDTDPSSNIGGKYDIEGNPINGGVGRKESLTRSMYNHERPYSADLIDTSANVQDGQFQVK